MRGFVLWCCFLLCSGMVCGQAVGRHGEIVWPAEHEFIKSVEFTVRAPDWTTFRGASTPAPAGAWEQVTYDIALQKPLVPGKAQVEISRREVTGGGQRLDYRVVFDQTQKLQGSMISMNLKTKALTGREVLAIPSLARLTVPAQAGSNSSLANFRGTGIAVRRDDGRYVVMAQTLAEGVLVQDSRKFGVDGIELRFLLGPQTVRAGRVYRNGVSVQVMEEAELRALYADSQPEFGDVSERLLLLAQSNGCVQLKDGRAERLMNIELAVHGVGWSYNSQSQVKDWYAVSDSVRRRRFSGSIDVPVTDGCTLDVEQTFSTDAAYRTGVLNYELTLARQVRLNGYQLSMTVPLSVYAGVEAVLETASGKELRQLIPETLGKSIPFSGKIRRFRLPHRQERCQLEVEFDRPVALMMQDNRGWGGASMEFRVMFQRAEEGVEQQPVRTSLQVTVRAGGDKEPLLVIPDDRSLPSRTDVSEWFPYVLAWDRPAPVDISFLNDAPAGKHGFVGVRDGRFVTLGNGQPIRFWGTCLSAGANFPSHEQAELIAKRLASYGINMVRTHHADAAWAERHFFRHDRDNTREFDAENLDRFDYFMACLKREGIYIYLDQLVNRRFKAGDGVDNAAELPTCGKPYSYFDRRLIELQKEFSRALWTHVNPYTGLAYKDDPAVAMMEFANENDLFSQEVVLEPYRTRFEAMYRQWAADHGVTVPEGKVDFRKRTDDITRFFIHVHDSYHAEMGAFLRELGVRVPMTGSNWTRNTSLLHSLDKLDFTDSHTYWNHPNRDGSFGTGSMLAVQRTVMDGMAFQKMAGRPFFISEWDAPWPYEYRAELPAWMAAVAAFQDWDGLTVYTYRHSSKPTDAITGAFENFNDPARFGLFPASALIYRRRDVAPGATVKTLAHDESAAFKANAPGSWNYPVLAGLSNVWRLACSFNAAPGEHVFMPTMPGEKRQVQVSEGGQIRHDIVNRTLNIDSPRSVVVTSFFKAGREVAVGSGRVKVSVPADRFGTIAVSSLTDEPVETSRRLLVTVSGRAENTGFVYSLMRNRRQATGQGPILCEPVRPEITVATRVPGLRVRPVNDRGERLPAVKATHADGRLSFKADSPTIYYLIEAE